MANYVYIATSIDGFIADKDGGLDWLSDIPNPDQSDFGFSRFMEKVDAILMGRHTFEQVLSFGEWPYTKKVFVLSHSLQTIPEHLSDQVEIIGGEIRGLVRGLQKRGFKDLYIDGGKTIQNFLRKDMIDEMIITVVPILLGDGVPLFGRLESPVKFREVHTKLFHNFLLQTTYRA